MRKVYLILITVILTFNLSAQQDTTIATLSSQLSRAKTNLERFGITNNIAIKSININYSSNPPGEPILQFFRYYEQGLMFGFGCEYKRWSGELRYETSNGISDYTSLKSPVHTEYILVGYKLFEL